MMNNEQWWIIMNNNGNNMDNNHGQSATSQPISNCRNQTVKSGVASAGTEPQVLEIDDIIEQMLWDVTSIVESSTIWLSVLNKYHFVRVTRFSFTNICWVLRKIFMAKTHISSYAFLLHKYLIHLKENVYGKIAYLYIRVFPFRDLFAGEIREMYIKWLRLKRRVNQVTRFSHIMGNVFEHPFWHITQNRNFSRYALFP